MRRTNQYVLERADHLRYHHTITEAEKWRIRSIMNGGAEGIAAILDPSGQRSDLGDDLPAVNMMASGVERLAQKVGQPPTLKMPYGARDSQRARTAGEKRERIVEGWDHLSNLKLQFPQVGRWLPGYGYTAWVLRPRMDPVTRQLWPHLELRDPYVTWPGYMGAGQQPHDVAFARSVPVGVLEAAYPDINWRADIAKRRNKPGAMGGMGGSVGHSSEVSQWEGSWEGQGDNVIVVEYHDDTGSYVMAPELEQVMGYIPNLLTTGPMFHVAKRFSFDRLVSQYHHVIGLVAMQAKLNVLALIAAEDSVFKETNIIGDLEGTSYERGRFAINFFEPGTRIEKPTGDNNQQLWQQIDRIERQLRIGAAYDMGSDSLAARGGFITGRGQEALRDPIEANITEYQTVIRHSMETLDMRRLEWEQTHERSKTKRVFWIQGDRLGEETYVPERDIDGAWRSKRVYGMMATWDDNSKIVAGLQLLQGGIIDRLTMQENLDGIDDVTQVNQRINQDRARNDLFAALEQMAAQGDPRAAMVLVEIMDRPDDTVTILKKFFTPQEPQMSPEEAAMAQQQDMNIGPTPDVQTVLSEMAMNGGVGGGVQTVAVNRG